ncbi:MAG: S8 family serine peptidase [Thermoanaerobaculia bacterium]
MAKRKMTRAEGPPDAEIPVLPPANGGMDGNGVETTGRFIIVFKDGAGTEKAAIRSTLNQVAGLRNVTASADFDGGAVAPEALADSEVVHFEKLGIVLVSGDQAVQELAASASDADSPILAIEPEYIAYPSGLGLMDRDIPLEYLRGYRDAVNQLYDQFTGNGTAVGEEVESSVSFQDTAQFTWGLQATRVSTSSRSGQGIKVAVLDTGLDFQHPDFQGRAIVSQSFVSGVTVQDVFGHGTHCIGTACGAQRPVSGVRRYGIAFGAQIFVGKVFNNAPRPQAATGSVIAGIEWAITNGCRIVSMSLGAPINQKIMQYEVPIQRALNAGTLVIAAAGNNASRPGNPGFVEPPANADAAMAVAAIDNQLQIARFSARSSQVTGVGGIVNLAAPGVAVFSSVPVSLGRHALFNGTSMATPHVAGIAALWAQATGESGAALWNRLVQTTRPLSLPSADVGMGMVQAPQ